MGDHLFPLTVGWCDESPRMRPHRTERLDWVGFDEIDPAAIVRPINHHSGNPFAAFPPQAAAEITQIEYTRLCRLNSVRLAAAKTDYLRDVARCAARRDEMTAQEYDSLPSDERQSLDRCTIT